MPSALRTAISQSFSVVQAENRMPLSRSDISPRISPGRVSARRSCSPLTVSLSPLSVLQRKQAQAVLDNQFRLLVRNRRASLAEELRIIRAPWQEALEVALVVTGTGRAEVTVDDDVHRFTARDTLSLLEAVTDFLRDRVVVPELRPVVLVTGLDGRDPVRVRIWPSRTTEFEYAED